MKAEQLLQISVAAMVAMGALLLGMSQQNFWIPALATFVAVTSVYLTDFLGWLRLHRQLANVVALVAVFIAIVDFAYEDKDYKLIAIANLLVYLQCVLMYQQKLERSYWLLAVLSFLQVVVASALNLEMEYGLLLALYSLVSLSTLILLCVCRECAPYVSATLATAAAYPATSVAATSRAAAPRERRRSATAHTAFDARSSSADPTLSMLNRGLVFLVLLIVAGTLVCSIAIFFFLPRFRSSGWQVSEDLTRLTGFSQEVSLDEIGQLLESPLLVMRVQFYDPQTEKPYNVHGEPYFRGSVLTYYEPIRGHWSQRRPRRPDSLFTRIQQPQGIGDIVRQRIMLQPQRTRTLFAVSPPYEITETPASIHWDSATNILLRQEKTGDRFEYTLDTSGFLAGNQVPALRAGRYREPGSECLQLGLDDDSIQILADKAEEILLASGVAADNRYASAKTLEAHFQRSGEYVYSLVMNERMSKEVDPIIDFVTRRKRGHCEHFASALTLMLRARGISARMVLGYKGAEFNSVGDYFQVRQLHTHTWVEAFLGPEEIPESLMLPPSTDSSGIWLRLDPTPAGDETELAEGVTLWEQLGQIRDYLQLLWNDYVLGLDSERQRDAVYDPFVRQVRALFSPESWSYFFHVLTVKVAERGYWFSWRAGLNVMAVGFFFVIIYRLSSGFVASRFVKTRARLNSRKLRRARRVDFYRRLERIVAQYGLRRRPHQTQREFARQVVKRISASPAAKLPAHITDAFYRVRFGGEQLDRQEIQELETALVQLEQQLQTHAKLNAAS